MTGAYLNWVIVKKLFVYMVVCSTLLILDSTLLQTDFSNKLGITLLALFGQVGYVIISSIELINTPLYTKMEGN